MKKIVLILGLSLTIALNKTQAQASVTDTLAYLQSIAGKKSQFTGKPFSVLVDSLKIQIKYFSPFTGLPGDNKKETATTFAFYFPQNEEELYLAYPCLVISWHSPLNAVQSIEMYNQNKGGWSTAIKTFYSTAVVTDIRVYR